MISAASAQIEAIGGDSMKITIIKNGKPKVVPDYAKVQGILLGAIATFVIFITIIGPECVFLPIFFLLNLGTLIGAICFRTETTDLTLSKRSRETILIKNGARLKTKRNLRKYGQMISTTRINHEVPFRSVIYFAPDSHLNIPTE